MIAGLREAAARSRDAVLPAAAPLPGPGPVVPAALGPGRRVSGGLLDQEAGAPLPRDARSRMPSPRLQEAVVSTPWVYLALRPRSGRWLYLRVHCESLARRRGSGRRSSSTSRSVWSTAATRSGLAARDRPASRSARRLPKLQGARSIGRGGEFLNRRLAGRAVRGLRARAASTCSIPALHSCRGQQLMINAGIADHRGAAERGPRRAGPLLRRTLPTTRSGRTSSERLAGARLRARVGPHRGADARHPAAAAGRSRGARPGHLRGASRAHPDDLPDRDPLAPRLLRPGRRDGAARHRRPGGLHPRPGARPRARDAPAAGGAGGRRRARDRGRHPADSRAPRAPPATSGWSRSSAPATPRILRVPFRSRLRRGRAALDLPLRGLALPRAVRRRGRARDAGRARRPARPDHRQLLRRQPGRHAARAAAAGHPVRDRPRAGEEQVPAVGPVLAAQRGAVPLLLSVHRPT